jgi:hypothetical protein
MRRFFASIGRAFRDAGSYLRRTSLVSGVIGWFGEENEGPVQPSVDQERSDGLPDHPLELARPPAVEEPDQEQRHPERPHGLNLCIDLGTFASTVARDHDGQVELAVLHYQRRGTGAWEPAYEISSAVLWIGDEPFMDPHRFAEMVKKHPGAKITRSFKRLLFECVWFEQNERNKRRLTAIYEELLLLALNPEKSSTLRLLNEDLNAVEGSASPPGRGTEAERLHLWKTEGGLPGRDRDRHLRESIVAGARLRLCVPNSFDAQSVDLSVGRLTEAFNSVVRKLFPRSIQFEPPNVSIVREAEAIAWCSDNVPAGVALVIDIGAGTTDAALVHLRGTNRADEAARLRVLYRTGVPFGGDDVDQVLLSAAYEDRLDVLEKMPRDAKLELTREARLRKEEWSTQKGTLRPDEIDYLRAALAREAKDELPETLVEAEGGGDAVRIPMYVRTPSPDDAGPYELSAGDSIGHPFRLPGFINFLRLAIMATCDPLLHKAKGQVTLVLLSGAASYTPGVAAALQILLDRHHSSAPIERIAKLLDRQPPLTKVQEVRRAKLACVYGGSRSLPFELAFDRRFLPESLRLEIRAPGFMREHELFGVGDRFDDGRLFAFYSIPEQVEHVCTIFRYFTPHEFIDPEYGGSSWVRRFVRRARLSSRTTDLAIELAENGEGASTLLAWVAYAHARNRLVPVALEKPDPPTPGRDRSPLTELPLEWLWDENDV